MSYIRSLPLSSVQDSGYIIVSQSLNSLAKTASTYAESGLGDYAVWLDDMLLTSSSDPAQASEAEIRHSNVEISARAIYWMPLGTMLLRSLPQLWPSLGIWLVHDPVQGHRLHALSKAHGQVGYAGAGDAQ